MRRKKKKKKKKRARTESQRERGETAKTPVLFFKGDTRRRDTLV